MECENFAMEVDSGDSEAEKTHEKSHPAGSVSDTGEQIPQQRPWHPAAGIVTQLGANGAGDQSSRLSILDQRPSSSDVTTKL
ncbi:unnamed protein product [Sphagnum balticum]